MISNETFWRLKRAGSAILSESVKHTSDREKRVYWINDMLRRYCKYVAKACKEAGVKMAKKSDKFKWNGYVNVEIGSSQVDLAEAFIGDEKKAFMALGQAVVDGYKIAVSFDAENENFRATLTCFDRDSPNFGYALGSFGSDWYTAVAACLFKHFEISDEDWTSYAPKSGRSFG